MPSCNRPSLPAFVGEDAASRALLRSIRAIAPSIATVLITGETGTGKEIVARHVHAASRRSSAPFVAVNCSALPETLVESELFGHERGAFTGAVATKAGWFESAHGGTLFLDEIGDLSLGVQVKLLRVLQQSEVVRVGSRRPIPIDVRVIAATNVRLDQAVAARRFREDLYYRLHVAPLVLAPLRQRRGDILPLARFFLEAHRDERGPRIVALAEDAERRLLEHCWPGNVRELENVVRHALLSCEKEVIAAGDLRFSRVPAAPPGDPASFPSPSAPALGEAGLSSRQALEDALGALFEENLPALHERVEQAVFRAAFRYCHRNQLQTARLLGVSRNVVRARLIEAGELAGPVRLPSASSWGERSALASGRARSVFVGDHFAERAGQTDSSLPAFVAER
jgi:sigma-54-specific transcriptional regulator